MSTVLYILHALGRERENVYCAVHALGRERGKGLLCCTYIRLGKGKRSTVLHMH